MPPDTYGLLRTLCSRNPKNIRNPPCSGYFLMFCGSQSHAFSCKHETHDLLTLVSGYDIMLLLGEVLSSLERHIPKHLARFFRA